MSKRTTALFVLVAGVILLVLSYEFWRLMGFSSQTFFITLAVACAPCCFLANYCVKRWLRV